MGGGGIDRDGGEGWRARANPGLEELPGRKMGVL